MPIEFFRKEVTKLLVNRCAPCGFRVERLSFAERDETKHRDAASSLYSGWIRPITYPTTSRQTNDHDSFALVWASTLRVDMIDYDSFALLTTIRLL